MGQSWTNRVHRVMLLCAVNLSLYLNCNAGVDQGGKKVTLNVVNESCLRVFKQIEKQTKMSFFYSTSDISLPAKVTVKAVEKPLDEVMGLILEGTGLEWIYTDNVITVRKKKELRRYLESTGDSSITMLAVTGKVTDANGEAIPGATVLVKRTRDGVTTDVDGKFALPKIKKNDVLMISSIGYETRELAVKGNTILAQLNLLVSKLDETVVIAYGTTTKRYNTGGVSTVKGEDIQKQPVSNPLQALQGRVPGLYITQQSGVPGGGYSVQLRGKNSINSGNEPLYIVDGVPYESTLSGSIGFSIIGTGSPLNYIDPMSIERIDVLKDADATAIYGSRGANGVILITTRKATQGKLKFSLNARSGFSKAARLANLMDRDQYLNMRREAFRNDNQTPGPLDYDLNGTWDTTKNFNWQKELIGNTSSFQDYQGTLSTASDMINFSLGTGYHRETTLFPGSWNDTKYSVRFNINAHSKNNKLKIDLSTFYLTGDNRQPQGDITPNIYTPPIGVTIHNELGDLNWENSTWTNPYGMLQTEFKSSLTNIIANTTISYEFLKNLTIKSNIGFTSFASNESTKFPYKSMPPIYYEVYGILNSATFNYSNVKTYNIEPQLEYNNTFNKSKLSILVGATLLGRSFNQTSVSAEGFLNDDLLNSIAGASKVTPVSTQITRYRYNALFGRINYNINDKYIVQLTGRRDGSSRFGPGNQFANFGAVGLAWIFSNEEFFRRYNSLISFGKLRASYGSTGNDQIGDYQFLNLYTPLPDTYQSNAVLEAIRLYNKNFAWEKNLKLEVGLELGLFKDRLLLTSTYFRNRSGNQLVGITLPNITGFSYVFANLAAVVQNKGLEFQLTSMNIKSSKFSWSTSFNISVHRNKLISYPGLEESGYQYVIGQSINMIKLFKLNKVNEQTGVYEFFDSEGKATSSPDYQKDRTVYLSTDPKYYGGISNTIGFGNLELDILFQFVKKLGGNPAFGSYYAPGQGIYNQPDIVLNRWQHSGDKADYQQYSASNPDVLNGYIYAKSSDKIFVDASYIRLKNLQLSYVIPTNRGMLNNITSIKTFIQAQNILTITKYKGLDPESTNLLSLPPLKTIVFGLNITL